MDSTLIPWIFAAIMTAGVTFLLISIFLGDFDLDADVDVDVDLDLDVDGALDGILGDGEISEGRNLGCMVISAFFSGFGAVGLMGSLSGWNVFFSILAGLFFGLVFGRSTAAAIRFVIRQEYTDLITTDDETKPKTRVRIVPHPSPVRFPTLTML